MPPASGWVSSPSYPAEYTVEDVLRTAFARTKTMQEEMDALAEQMAAGDHSQQTLRRYGDLNARFEGLGGWDTDTAVSKVASGLSIDEDMRRRLFAELSGGEPMTTNNRMELRAAIEGLSALKQPCRVTLTSDSKYLVDAVTKGWVYGWQKKGWKKSDNSPALNVDLWERLLPLLKYHEVEFVWVKGHAGHPENERCDRLAVAWYQSYQAGCAAKMSE